MPVSPYSATERLEAMMAATYAAVAEHFGHIAVRHIINPPHTWFDAALARQIVVHILNTRFNVPRRRICIMMNRQRGSIAFACQQIDRRRRDPVFDAAYTAIAARAKALFLDELMSAAA